MRAPTIAVPEEELELGKGKAEVEVEVKKRKDVDEPTYVELDVLGQYLKEDAPLSSPCRARKNRKCPAPCVAPKPF